PNVRAPRRPCEAITRAIAPWSIGLWLIVASALPAFGEHGALTWPVQTIDADRLKGLIERGEKLFIVDVGSPEEFRAGHIPAARFGLRVANTFPSGRSAPGRSPWHCSASPTWPSGSHRTRWSARASWTRRSFSTIATGVTPRRFRSREKRSRSAKRRSARII